ncbi:MAG TPA: flagellar type III secretion system protein FlhB [Stellaceae bacterium]|jgi:flagellar biosynthetic protein FlhB|nr:flagellar type III secretion system protein FlhB [Stellaceae bacterium]
MSDTSHEDKTEQPTRRRIEKAREEGSIARVQGLPGAAIMLTAAIFFLMGGRSIIGSMERSLRVGLALDTATMREPSRMFAAAWHVLAPPFEAAGVLIVLLAVIAVIANLAVGGWVFSPGLLTLDPQRINPLAGLKRQFSREGLAEIVKSLVKVIVIGAIAYFVLRDALPALVDLGRESWRTASVNIADLATHALLMFAAGLALVVALEVPYQLWSHRGRLRMTRQEVRDEMRDLEVSVHTKRRLRALRNRFARARMMTEVPRADVVITNPDHYAAALRYQEGTMRAPRLVAKGGGLVALRIREIATEHHVPIVEAPPLARAIYRFVGLEEEIPVGLYQAIAEVLAYVYRLRVARDTSRPAPPLPGDRRFEPPEEFRVE